MDKTLPGYLFILPPSKLHVELSKLQFSLNCEMEQSMLCDILCDFCTSQVQTSSPSSSLLDASTLRCLLKLWQSVLFRILAMLRSVLLSVLSYFPTVVLNQPPRQGDRLKYLKCELVLPAIGGSLFLVTGVDMIPWPISGGLRCTSLCLPTPAIFCLILTY